MCTLKCCGTFCAGFSTFCLIALVVTGAVIYSGSEMIELEGKSHLQAATNCFVGAAMYAFCIFLSVICLCVDRIKSRKSSSLEADA